MHGSHVRFWSAEIYGSHARYWIVDMHGVRHVKTASEATWDTGLGSGVSGVGSTIEDKHDMNLSDDESGK